MIRIVLFAVCFFLCRELYAIPKEIDFSPLNRLVGLSFLGPADSFRVHDENIHGDAVGTAYFSDQTHFYTTSVLWYWDSKSSFQIIASSFSLPRRDLRSCFNFCGAYINDNGVVACSYLDGADVFEYGWFCWSKKEGLRLDSPTQDYQLIRDINNKDYILIHRFRKLEASTRGGNNTAIVINIHDANDRKTFFCIGDALVQQQQLGPLIQDWAEKEYLRLNPRQKLDKISYKISHWYCCTAQKLTDDFIIHGRAVADVELLSSSCCWSTKCYSLIVKFAFDLKGGPWDIQVGTK